MQDNITIEIAAQFVGREAVQAAIASFNQLQDKTRRTGDEFVRMKSVVMGISETYGRLNAAVRENKITVDQAAQSWQRYINGISHLKQYTGQIQALALADYTKRTGISVNPENLFRFDRQAFEAQMRLSEQAALARQQTLDRMLMERQRQIWAQTAQLPFSGTGNVQVLDAATGQIRQQAAAAEAAQRRVTAAARETTAETQRHSSLIGGALVGNLIRVVFAYHAIRAAAQGVANTVGQVFKTIERGAEIELVEQRFNNLAKTINTTGPSLLAALTEVSSGMQSRFQLMEGAVKFTTLGFAENEQQAARLVNVASQLNWNMNQVVLTMANLSWRRLDSLSLSIDAVRSRMNALREAGMTTQQAFREAVILEGEAKVTTYGDVAETTAGKINILKASWNNFKDSIATHAVDEAKDSIAQLADEAGDLSASFDDVAESIGRAIGKTAEEIALIAEYLALKRALEESGAIDKRKPFGDGPYGFGPFYDLGSAIVDDFIASRLKELEDARAQVAAIEKAAADEAARAARATQATQFTGGYDYWADPALVPLADSLRKRQAFIKDFKLTSDQFADLYRRDAGMGMRLNREMGLQFEFGQFESNGRTVSDWQLKLTDQQTAAMREHIATVRVAHSAQIGYAEKLRAQFDYWRRESAFVAEQYRELRGMAGGIRGETFTAAQIAEMAGNAGVSVEELKAGLREYWRDYSKGFSDLIDQFQNGSDTIVSSSIKATLDTGAVLEVSEAMELYQKNLGKAQEKLQMLNDTQATYNGTQKAWQSEVNKQTNLIEQYTTAIQNLQQTGEQAGANRWGDTFAWNIEQLNGSMYDLLAGAGWQASELAGFGVYIDQYDAQTARMALIGAEAQRRMSKLAEDSAAGNWSMERLIIARNQLWDSFLSGDLEREMQDSGMFVPLDVQANVGFNLMLDQARVDSELSDLLRDLHPQIDFWGQDGMDFTTPMAVKPELEVDYEALWAEAGRIQEQIRDFWANEAFKEQEPILTKLLGGSTQVSGSMLLAPLQQAMANVPDIGAIVGQLEQVQILASQGVNMPVTVEDEEFQTFLPVFSTFTEADHTTALPILADPEGSFASLRDEVDTWTGTPHVTTLNVNTSVAMANVEALQTALLNLVSRTYSTTVTINQRTVKTEVSGGTSGGGGGGGRESGRGVTIQQTIVNEMVPLDAGKIAKAMQTGMEGALAQIGF